MQTFTDKEFDEAVDKLDFDKLPTHQAYVPQERVKTDPWIEKYKNMSKDEKMELIHSYMEFMGCSNYDRLCNGYYLSQNDVMRFTYKYTRYSFECAWYVIMEFVKNYAK